MPYLTDEQIAELSPPSFINKRVFITRAPSKVAYHLICQRKRGMKGVIWRAKDDLGNDVALKIIPSADYAERSLIDEMTDASKLDPRYGM